MHCQHLTIHLATDHAGFAHKEAVKEWLLGEGYHVVDHGAEVIDSSDDYPDFIIPAAEAVSNTPQESRGVVFGGSGQGEAMVANKFRNVRAAVFYGGPDNIITLSREHNDANVLSIGARFVTIDDSKRAIWDWLHTEFAGDERHVRRLKKVTRVGV